MDAIILLALLTLVAIIFLILLARRWHSIMQELRERLRTAEVERYNALQELGSFREKSKYILELLGYQPLSPNNLLQKFDEMISVTEASRDADKKTEEMARNDRNAKWKAEEEAKKAKKAKKEAEDAKRKAERKAEEEAKKAKKAKKEAEDAKRKAERKAEIKAEKAKEAKQNLNNFLKIMPNLMKELNMYEEALKEGRSYETLNIHRQIDECECPDNVKEKVREELNKLIERVQRNN